MSWFGLSGQDLLYWKQLKDGDSADIIIDPQAQEVYTSQIEEVTDHGIYLLLTQIRDRIVIIRKGAHVKINVYKGSGIFHFESTVLEENSENKRMVVIAKPKHITRTQRRKHFRLNILLPIEYGVLSPGDDRLQSDVPVPFLGITKDISEGGLIMVGDRPLTMNSLLKMRVNLDANIWVTTIAKVLDRKPASFGSKFNTRVQFIKLGDPDKDEIRKFVFQKASTLKKVVEG